MERSANHLVQWKHNRALIAHIPPSHPDWIVTVCFYTALQAVDGLLTHDKVMGITSHDSRNGVLMKTNRYLHIYKAYHPLYGLSRTVRYLADPTRWVPIEKIADDVFRRLYQVEGSVQKLMGTDLALGKLTVMPAT